MYLELVGFTCMGITYVVMADAFDTSHTFMDYIHGKNVYFDTWMRKLEKSNQPNYMNHNLCQKTRESIDDSFRLDYNTII
jgi:hypothetical protein